MRQFWDPVVKPLLEAAQARRLIEVGADAGDHTLRLSRWCRRHSASLEVIDPKPGFDVERFDTDYAGARLHLALSLDVLAGLLPADVVLIDGDHNWYTVFHEIGLCYGKDGPLPPEAPILILHDVAWPYGRRDLYYDIETIPPEGRQPSRIGPLAPGVRGMSPSGLNAPLRHAEREGGPRNGVRTAVEDALAGRMDEVRIVWLNVLFGLGVVVPRSRLEAAPALDALLDRLEPSPEWAKLAAVTEHERVMGAAAIQQREFTQGGVWGP